MADIEKLEPAETDTTTPTGKRDFWLAEIDLASKAERTWRIEAAFVEDLYESEKMRLSGQGGESRTASNNMNIFFSNTETLRPALYSSTPAPDVRRMFPQADDTAKHIAQVIERAIAVTVDQNDFDDEMEMVVTDHLITGRGVPRIDYEVENRTVTDVEKTPVVADGGAFTLPDGRSVAEEDLPGELSTEPDGSLVVIGKETTHEEFVGERVILRRVQWNQIRFSGNAKSWSDVWWLAFRHEMTREDMRRARIPAEVAKETELSLTPDDKDGKRSQDRKKDQRDSLNRAEVWEVWNKRDRTRIFVSSSFPDKIMHEEPDPLGLVDFFPIPKPLYSIRRLQSLVPIPEYKTYRDQAVELHKITGRIDNIVDALKVRGVYDQSMASIADLLKGSENKMIPVEEWGSFVDKGGLAGVVDWMPIDQLSVVLASLYQQRALLVQMIYEITGISDVIRGATDARETATAQQLKGQFGQLRLSPRQRRVERMARSIFRIMAEVVAEKFSPETLQQMTGLQVSPEHMELMKSDRLRNFRIDVETDSTVLPDDRRGKEEVTEFLSSLGGFMEIAAPLVQSGMVAGETVKLLMLWAARRFKVSREVEDALEQADTQGQGQQGGGDEEGGGDQATAQAKMMELQIKERQDQAELEAHIAEAQGEQRLELMKIHLEFKMAERDAELKRLELQIKAAQVAVSSRQKAAA